MKEVSTGGLWADRNQIIFPHCMGGRPAPRRRTIRIIKVSTGGQWEESVGSPAQLCARRRRFEDILYTHSARLYRHIMLPIIAQSMHIGAQLESRRRGDLEVPACVPVSARRTSPHACSQIKRISLEVACLGGEKRASTASTRERRRGSTPAVWKPSENNCNRKPKQYTKGTGKVRQGYPKHVWYKESASNLACPTGTGRS